MRLQVHYGMFDVNFKATSETEVWVEKTRLVNKLMDNFTKLLPELHQAYLVVYQQCKHNSVFQVIKINFSQNDVIIIGRGKNNFKCINIQD